jgi:dolichol-phosphate mannosyltransferase
MNFDFTVIIPTLNEEAIIGCTIQNVQETLKKENLNAEILIVDDNSSDNTIVIVDQLQANRRNISLIIRQQDHGLSQSIMEGFGKAASPVFIVMDADGQHPAEQIPELYRKINEGNDIVIGSRYMNRGEIKNWTYKRKVLSWGATFLARLFFPNITDPVSGFFAVRKEVVFNAPLKPQGYKILLEVLGKGHWERAEEIPFTFGSRESGSSKLSEKTIVEYAKQVIGIAVFAIKNKDSTAYTEIQRAIKFMVVGLSGMMVNIGLLFYLTEFWGIYFLFSGMISIECSIITNFFLNDVWTFGENKENKHRWGMRLVLFQVVSLGGVILNLSLLYVLTTGFGIYYLVSSLIGIFCAFFWNFLVNRKYTWQKAIKSRESYDQ